LLVMVIHGFRGRHSEMTFSGAWVLDITAMAESSLPKP
jgi:hypothetical protein